ncbi:NAD(P)H-hydrate dehydratase [Paucibacter sp. R3-3]|uniref:Bifunctional NAD(P)H-hydrate repair enzyme n=1 Tax=Roseateles agri TaxID=3098619 RepID=A0ABU5DMY4_9BURK|nr:NAD(P)H-hydrate dehydratase [Paucibacter sp. R3-3]MDY0747091.1 NAD(P)H-hydrate dehydratase [Paucibacter sp. R3-3]
MSLRRIIPLAASLPLFGTASSRAIETAALAGRPEDELMERAGLAVARLTLALQPREGAIWVACGPGNNGGDGRIAARLLAAQGRRVHVGLEPPAEPVALAIDALLGLGLNRPPSAELAAAIARINALDAPVIAVDLPSGLLADTGVPIGTQAVRADHTLSLLTLKPGLFTAQGRAQAGQIWFDDLGVTPTTAPDALLLGRDAVLALPLDPAGPASHKGVQGNVLLVGGAAGMQGALLLAGRAALAAGAGRVYLRLLDEAAAEFDTQRPELMHARYDTALAGKTVIAGCGGGAAIGQDLAPVIEQASRLVLDADALNAVAADPLLRQALKDRDAQTILTPHPLEAARLLGCTVAEVQAGRLRAAQTLADELHCTVVLKGSGSAIASPGRLPAINTSGSAALATAGTGDVLAGWIGGLWAQMPHSEPAAIAAAAVHWHGHAGESQAAGPLRAADLVERMHALHAWARGA